MTQKRRKAERPRCGSPFPIDHGASTRILWRREFYGGKKGRAARARLRALERRIARSGVLDALMRGDMERLHSLLFGIRTTLRDAVTRAAAVFQ